MVWEHFVVLELAGVVCKLCMFFDYERMPMRWGPGPSPIEFTFITSLSVGLLSVDLRFNCLCI